MHIQRHFKFSAFFQQWFHPGIVNMQTPTWGWVGIELSEAFVTQFPYTLGSFLMTSFQFCHGIFFPAWLIITGVVKAAPNVKPVFMTGIFIDDRIKPGTGSIR